VVKAPHSFWKVITRLYLN